MSKQTEVEKMLAREQELHAQEIARFLSLAGMEIAIYGEEDWLFSEFEEIIDLYPELKLKLSMLTPGGYAGRKMIDDYPDVLIVHANTLNTTRLAVEVAQHPTRPTVIVLAKEGVRTLPQFAGIAKLYDQFPELGIIEVNKGDWLGIDDRVFLDMLKKAREDRLNNRR